MGGIRKPFTKCRGYNCNAACSAANRTPNGCYCDKHYAAWTEKKRRQAESVALPESGDPIWTSPQLAQMAREATPMTPALWQRMSAEFAENARKWFAYHREAVGRKKSSSPSRGGTSGGHWIPMRSE